MSNRTFNFAEYGLESGVLPPYQSAKPAPSGAAILAGPVMNPVKRQKLFNPRLNPSAFSVMTSPPTVTNTDTGNVAWTGSSLSTGQPFPPVNYDGVTSGNSNTSYSVFRGRYPSIPNFIYPNYLYSATNTITSAPGVYATLISQYSTLHTGSKIAIQYKGTVASIWIKINDQFINATPIVIPGDGNTRVTIIDFGSVGSRRIDIIGYNLYFGGFWTDLTDSLMPAPKRGVSIFAITDSFGEGAGNETNALLSYLTYAAEYLGCDDLVASSLGSTGLIAGNLVNKLNYVGRVVRDIVQQNPDAVLIQQSTNDQQFAPNLILTALQTLINAINAAFTPGNGPIIIITSPSITSGAGKLPINVRDQNAVCRGWARSQNYIYIDEIEMPLDGVQTPHSTSITTPVSIGATTLITTIPLIIGAHYKFGDGYSFFVRTTVGVTATIDYCPSAQVAGAILTQCGPCYLTGTGNAGALAGWGSCDVCVSGVDGIHPLNRGHRVKGFNIASQLVKQAML